MDLLTAGYGLLVAGGGIAGYAKAKSVPSLAAGVICGSVMLYGAYQMGQNPKNYYLSLATSGLLTGVMGKRFYSSGKFMPAGLVAALSLLMVVRLGYVAVKN